MVNFEPFPVLLVWMAGTALESRVAMADATSLPETCRHLRELDAAISAQRRLVAALKAQDLDTEVERRRLTQLLAELDSFLRELNLHHAA
jgi:hypothetical protein